MTTRYSRSVITSHMTNMYMMMRQQRAIYRSSHKEVGRVSQQVGTLSDQVDVLNQSVLNLTRLNETMRLEVTQLNESMLGYQSFIGTETSFMASDSNSGLLSQKKHIPSINREMDVGRWNCIMVVAQKHYHTHKSQQAPLEELLEKLLKPSIKTDEADDVVEQWCAKYSDGTYKAIQEQLNIHTNSGKLDPFVLKPSAEERYYQAAAYCFSQGIFFPRVDSLAETFNLMRPSKRSTLSTVTEADELKGGPAEQQKQFM